MKKLTWLCGLILLYLTMASSAMAAAVTSFDIIGFGFAMNQPNEAEGGTDQSVNENVIITTLEMGAYQGGSNPFLADGSTVDFSQVILGCDFFQFGPLGVITTPDDSIYTSRVYEAPSAELTGNTLTVNLPSWSAVWNGNIFNQANATGITATVRDDGSATLIWTTHPVGPYAMDIGHWSLEIINIQTVPEPASLFLIGSGLAGLVGLRRKK